ncbi:10662_t:CDS:2 [Funneliformis caledonium]|uniref:10662_t:CDS:1 n=2 Tax=Funneliformis TaxID=1117308 RepID=A0A9N8YNM1_9GLOM|nr:10662_t:CDS:2 [Funneliformis caledonium]
MVTCYTVRLSHGLYGKLPKQSIYLVKQFKRTMDETDNNGIRRTFQAKQNSHSIWHHGQADDSTLYSSNSYNHNLGRLSPALDVLYKSSSQEKNDAPRSDFISGKDAGTIGEKNYGNDRDGSSISPSNSKPHIFNTEKDDFKVHVWDVDPLWEIENRGIQQTSDKFEIDSDTDVGVELEFCPNRQKIQSMHPSLGNCAELEAHKECGSQIPMHEVSVDGRFDGSQGHCNNLFIVDKIENESDRRRIATFISYEFTDENDDLIFYSECVKEYGLNHIIVIGQLDFGIIFLDCYGRVFEFNDMSQMFLPLGNSLAELSIKNQAPHVAWIIKSDGDLYEYDLQQYFVKKDNKSKKNSKKKKRKKR